MIKTVFSRLDRFLFSSFFGRLGYQRRHDNLVKSLLTGAYSNWITMESRQTFSRFRSLCDLYGSDKSGIGSSKYYSHPAHNYALVYERLFYGRHSSISSVLEFGLGTNNQSFPQNMGLNARPGASLYLWREYFPNAKIFGADIDRNILFEDTRIKTFFVDQEEKTSVKSMLDLIGPGTFDLVVDDGAHTTQAHTTCFDVVKGSLSLSGLYIIEDLTLTQASEFASYAEQWIDEFVIDFILSKRLGIFGYDFNVLMIARRKS